MRLRNKKTGQIGDLMGTERSCPYITIVIDFHDENPRSFDYVSLAELNEEWEDAPEEPKEYWFIDAYGGIVQNRITKHRGDAYTDMTDLYESQKEIGNYFETAEEAEKAVKKLKAWKRLKDKGFRFDGVEAFSEGLLEIDAVLPTLEKAAGAERLKIGVLDDLWLLFRGEE